MWSLNYVALELEDHEVQPLPRDVVVDRLEGIHLEPAIEIDWNATRVEWF